MNQQQMAALDSVQKHDSLQREVTAGERLHQHLSKNLIHMPGGEIHVGYEASCHHWFREMDYLADRILHSNLPPFREHEKVKNGKSVGTVYKVTEVGRLIWIICTQGLYVVEDRFPKYHQRNSPAFALAPLMNWRGGEFVLHPRTWLILRACQRAAPVLYRHCGINPPDLRVKEVRDAMLRLVRSVCKVWRSKRLQRMESKRRRNEEQRMKSCCHYIATRFTQFSCLLIGRVDLYIRPEHREWSNSEEVEHHLRLFLRALGESRIVPDVKAWICKRENGPDRGIHFHVLYALDGHKHREAASYSKILGEAWVKRVGAKRSSYFNCTVREDEYTYNALGLVRISDRKKLLGIREAIRYMVKGDGYLLTGRQRNLWRGVMGKSWSAVKRGAPRKPEHDMTLVEEILGSF